MARAFALCALAYLVAGAVAVATALSIDVTHPVQVAAAGDVAATLAIFAFSFAFGNSSFYDAYWSVAPIPIALYWCAVAAPDAVGPRQIAVVVLVAAWGIRLTANWAWGWQGLGHEDWRYVNLRESTGRAYWLVSLVGLHGFPTVMVFLGLLPVYAAVAVGTRPFGWLDVVALVVTATAIAIEARADEELRRFRRAGPAPDAILSTGLWRSSRHPNYFGEMLFWWGLFLFALAGDPAWWWTGIGALAISVMFVFVSLPMVETRMLERRPAYADHAKTTSLVVPWFSRS